MASPTVTVVRYTALLSGIVYGFYHRITLQKAHDQKKVHKAAARREKLIAEAKEAWRRKQQSTVGDSGVISDPDHPQFDLEKLISKWENA